MIQTLQSGLILKRVLLGCMMFGIGITVDAQDFHFTDFRMAPSLINPGLTGSFKGTYRLNGIYRDQWRSFGSNKPFQTFLLSGDINVKSNLLLDNDWISGGLSILSDQAGVGGLKTTITGLQIGYHLGFDKDYKNVVSIGVNYGSASISATGFTRAEELGQTQPDFSQSGGSYIPPTLNNPNGGPKGNDLSVGVTFKTEAESGTIFRTGISLNHINRRDATIVRTQVDSTGGGPGGPIPPNPNRGRKEDPVLSNFVLFGEASTLLSPRVRVNPALLFMTAGGNTQMQLQSTADYLLNVKQQFSVTGGLGIRAIPFDAAYLMGGVRIKDLSVRLSYDITLSSLRDLRGGNAFELSVGYIGRIYRDAKSDKVIFCPRL